MQDKSWRLRLLYAGGLLTVYFGFFLACAFSPTVMAARVAAGPVTLSMALGAAIMIAAVALTGVYALTAERE